MNENWKDIYKDIDINYDYKPDIGEGEPRTLTSWAMFIAVSLPDIAGRVSTVVRGRRLKKTHASGLEALLEQAGKKDGNWYFFRGKDLYGDCWLFYKGKLTCRYPDMEICQTSEKAY